MYEDRGWGGSCGLDWGDRCDWSGLECYCWRKSGVMQRHWRIVNVVNVRCVGLVRWRRHCWSQRWMRMKVRKMMWRSWSEVWKNDLLRRSWWRMMFRSMRRMMHWRSMMFWVIWSRLVMNMTHLMMNKWYWSGLELRSGRWRRWRRC